MFQSSELATVKLQSPSQVWVYDTRHSRSIVHFNLFNVTVPRQIGRL